MLTTKDTRQPRVPKTHVMPLPIIQDKTALDEKWLRQLCLDAGADDVGFVHVSRPEVDVDRNDVLIAAPWTKTLISFVIRMNKENIRTPMRSLANVEFHASDDQVTETSRRIVRTLERQGVRALHTAFGFPMETDRWPAKMWVVSHKLIAEGAGLGRRGLHRNLIHPKFGSFIFLGTVLIDREVTQESTAIDYDPCVTCKLCVAACPTGAISPDGHFNFSACYTHNYREFMGGFGDWVESVADSKNAKDYRRRVTDTETVSMWQSLSFESNYKAAYCLSVCPAGDDVIGEFVQDKRRFKNEILKPLVEKEETIYVVPGSDAEPYVAKRFPHKKIKRVGNGLRARTIRVFLDSLPHVFQRGQAAGLDATYHFTFTGEESMNATVVIRDKTVTTYDGHVQEPNVRIIADSATWLGFVAKEKNLVWALLRRKIRIKGSPRWLLAFGKCFPS